jgi:hypothetical protein
MVALELLAMAAVDIVKFADVAAAATVMDELTVSFELVFERVTPAPPEGAGWVRLTVQVPEEFGPTLLGLHDKEDTVTDADATRFRVVFAELPL